MPLNDSAALDAVRRFCNLLVVVLHAGIVTTLAVPHGLEVRIWGIVCYHLAPILLPALFLLSGFLTLRDRPPEPFGAWLLRRTKRLLMPYLLWNGLCLILFRVGAPFVPRLAMRVHEYGLDTTSGLLRKLVALDEYPIDPPLWFLRTLFLLMVATPLLRILLNKLPRPAVVAVALAPMILLPHAPEAVQACAKTFPPYAFALFLLGGLIARQGVALTRAFAEQRWILAGMAILLTGLELWGSPEATPIGATLTRLAPIIQAAALWSFAEPLAKIFGSPRMERLCPAGAGYFLYAAHFLTASIPFYLLAPRIPDGPGKVTLLGLIFIASGIGISLGLWHGARRIAPKALAALDGTLTGASRDLPRRG